MLACGGRSFDLAFIYALDTFFFFSHKGACISHVCEWRLERGSSGGERGREKDVSAGSAFESTEGVVAKRLDARSPVVTACASYKSSACQRSAESESIPQLKGLVGSARKWRVKFWSV